ncbi:MAG TPA: substrate-binding domain-containing protein [Fimbriimonadaceae bacterium]|nr:substrate-binding domain-containing protein [Fimbriimonadaceae bacterium]
MRINSVKALQLLCGLAAIAVLAGCNGGATGSGGAQAGNATTSGPANASTKVAFIVKKPDEPWFQLEWRFADQAAKDDSFQLIKLPATDSTAVIPAIDNAAAQGAQGLVICTPDVNLGPAIVNECKKNNMKLITVDDQLVGPDHKFIDGVHHVGISAHKIGEMVGHALMAEMKKRGWNPAETGMLVVTYEELDTAKQRTDGEIGAAEQDGFPAANVYKMAEKGQDVSDSKLAATTVLTQHQQIKNWLVTSMNDAGCVGGVRATETFNIAPDHVIGIGINGDTSAIDDLKKPLTGLFGTVLLQAKIHGYHTSDMMYHWIKDGKQPPMITYTDGILMTRDNFKQVLTDQGLENELN